MQKIIVLGLAAMLGVAIAGVEPAAAQNNRSFVSQQGLDTNNCSLTAPCRSFQVAVNNTNPGGEVVALNSAGYGTVTINKAITISSIGVEGAITTTTGQTGITIAAGTSDAVRLNSLTLIGGGVGATGISVTTAGSVILQDCIVTGFTGDGVTFSPNSASTLTVGGGIFANNGGNGLTIAPSGASAVYAFVGGDGGVPVFTANTVGVLVNGSGVTQGVGLHATLSINANRNTSHGIEFESANFEGSVFGMVTETNSVNNAGDGLFATSSSDARNVTVYVDRLQASGNAIGWATGGGGAFIESYGNNHVNGNGSDTTMPTISQE